MRRGIGRHSLFFAVASLVCVALVPAMPQGFRWVAWSTAGLGGFWAILLAIEDLTAPRGEEKKRSRPPPESPFAPPPPPGA